MEQRAGVEDALLAFAICSGVVLLADMVERRQNQAKAAAKEKDMVARLNAIESGIAALHAARK